MRFAGNVGFVRSVETAPGVWDDVVTLRNHYGDVVRDTRTWTQGEKVNPDLRVGQSISIVVDDFAIENVSQIKFVSWAGVLWTVVEVELQRPRLLLRLGGEYNGI